MTRQIGILVVLVALGAGCAAHRAPSLAAGLVKESQQAAEQRDPQAQAGRPLEEYIEKLRQLAASARPRPATSTSTTIESRDPALAAALVGLAAEPTAERQRAVAAEYLRVGVLDDAYAHLNRAAQLDPHDAAAYEGLARIWRMWGFAHLGLADAHRAVYFAPLWPVGHNTLGTIYEALGMPEAAEQEFRTAFSLDPRAAYALNNLCYVLVRQGSFERAADACRQAVALDPALDPARLNLAAAERLRAATPPAEGGSASAETASTPPISEGNRR
jgi:Flp pilus assembly protein TadD